MGFLAATICQLVPGTIDWGPGWYLVAANARVEAGPFPSEAAALAGGGWLEDGAMGVHPAWEVGPPYLPRYSQVGLIVGSRLRDRGKKSAGELVASA